jgi:hypothetical protein
MMPVARVFIFNGNVRKDDFGRIVVDTCESDGAHLRKDGPLPEGDDRWRCRNLVEQAFDHVVGKKGKLVVSVSLVETDE